MDLIKKARYRSIMIGIAIGLLPYLAYKFYVNESTTHAVLFAIVLSSLIIYRLYFYPFEIHSKDMPYLLLEIVKEYDSEKSLIEELGEEKVIKIKKLLKESGLEYPFK